MIQTVDTKCIATVLTTEVVQGVPKGHLVLKDESCSLNNLL
jgi:hypothetical protein